MNPSPDAEKKMHKLKKLVQAPNSFFMDVKCPGRRIFGEVVGLVGKTESWNEDREVDVVEKGCAESSVVRREG